MSAAPRPVLSSGYRSIPRTGLLFGWAAFTFLIVFLHLRYLPYAHDDSYIHMRIASNLAHYGVPYYNLDEVVKGSSSTVWTILLAVLIRLTGETPFAVAVLNALLSTTGAAVYTKIFRIVTHKTSPDTLWIFPLVLAFTLLSSIGLMESSLAVLVLGVSILLFLHGNSLCGVLWGAMIFIRLEFAVFLVLFGMHVFIVRPFSRRRIALMIALGIVPFIAFDYLFFGGFIPNTAAAKSKVYDLTFRSAFGYMTGSTTPGSVLREAFDDGRFAIWVMVGVALFIEGVCLLKSVRKLPAYFAQQPIRQSLRQFVRELVPRFVKSSTPTRYAWAVQWLPNCTAAVPLILGIGGVTIAAVYVATRVLLFPWYVPLFAVPMTVFAWHSITQQFRRWGLAITLGLSLFVFASLVQTLASSVGSPNWFQNFGMGGRVRAYQYIGEVLYRYFPDSALMTSEIGGLGYTFRGYIADGVGLISKEALKYHPLSIPDQRRHGADGAIPVGYIREVNPGLVVSYERFIDAFMMSDLVPNYFQFIVLAQRPEDAELGAKAFGRDTFLVYIRQDLLCSLASDSQTEYGRLKVPCGVFPQTGNSLRFAVFGDIPADEEILLVDAAGTRTTLNTQRQRITHETSLMPMWEFTATPPNAVNAGVYMVVLRSGDGIETQLGEFTLVP
jgi:hypothetical protein